MLVDTSATKVLHELFEARVREAPDSIAVDYRDQCISYGDLNRKANRLAHHLRTELGVRPDDRVAVMMHHPPSVAIAILATLKAGGAYVPLDPGNSPAVTQQILDDAAPATLLLESSCAAGAAYFDGNLFVMDVESVDLETADTDLTPVATGSNLAYVIYTSGTTGTPKGVAVEHRSIVNTITWRNSYYAFSTGDATLAISRPSFDSSVEDIFCTLTSGGRLLLLERERITDQRYLAALITERAVTHFLITPALYKRLLGGLTAEGTTSLRAVTIAGEWFTKELVLQHFQRLPEVALYNEYGPSENSVCSTVHPLCADDSTIFIGKPIDNIFAFAMKEDGTPAGVGEIGELYLGGAGLARGYLGNPDLTADRFITMRSPDGVPARVFRSGDLVRVCTDHNLQFIGRTDRQVKIRGQRVELDHVSECLANDPVVDEVHVLLHAPSQELPRLVAFVTGCTRGDIARLEKLTREELPTHMVPHTIMAVEDIPITGHGKVDERALLKTYERPGTGRQPAAMSATEASLLAIWRILFSRTELDLDDDFFELGGDSLTVMDLVSEVEDLLGIQIENADAYTHRTIRNFARLIERRKATVLES